MVSLSLDLLVIQLLIYKHTYIVRDYPLDDMKYQNAEFSSLAEKRSVNQCIEQVCTWGTEIEIITFATMMDICIYTCIANRAHTKNYPPKMG